MKWVSFGVILVISIALQGYVLHGYAPEQRGRIVILGDSLTSGYGVGRENAYPAILQKKIDDAKLPFDVINKGVSGDTTLEGLRRLQGVIEDKPDVLVVALGGNDGLRRIEPSRIAENLRKIIQKVHIKSPEAKIVIAGMRMPEEWLGSAYAKEYNAVFSNVARETNSALIPYLLEGVGGVTRLNQADLIHPTAEGQKGIAENVWKVLRCILERQARS